jgi:hypothetical protein
MADEAADQTDARSRRDEVGSDLTMDELSRRRRLRSSAGRAVVEATKRGGRAVPLPASSGIVVLSDQWVEVVARPIEGVELLDLVVADAANWLLQDASIDGRRASLPFPCGLGQLSRWLRQREGHVWSCVDAGADVLLRVSRSTGEDFLYAAWIARSTKTADHPSSLGRLGRIPLWRKPDPIRVPREKSAQLVAPIPPNLRSPVLVESIVLRRAADWVVDDVRIDGRSCLAQAGDVPGTMLEALAAHDLDLGVAAREVILVVTYVGEDSDGGILHGDVLVAETQF